ncbi:MAG: phage tail sheath subtilisin-like domain-containing protein [Verrucomicrobium sp.]|nr:phage tail sheath subtilisin-like domain-containing protein [Verrucomicrobium sp.]
MPEQFLHGVEVVEVSDGTSAISTVKSSVIGLIGTAPDSQEAVTASMATGSVGDNTALTWTSKLAGALGNDISVSMRSPGTASAPLSITVSGKAIIVSLATSAAKAITTTATLLKTAIAANASANALVTVASTGVSTGAGVLGYQATSYLSGGLDEAFPLNTPVLIAGSATAAAALGSNGTLPAAIDDIFDQVGAAIVVVRVEEGDDAAETAANIVGSAAASSGVYAFLGAESAVGVAPRILVAPEFTDDPTNGVVQELLIVAARLRAVVIADGPSMTDSDAVQYIQNFGSDRLYVVDPAVKVVVDGVTVIRPASARVAGIISLGDNARGFWWSPSNQEIAGIVGTERPINFSLGDPNSQANLLNESNIATIIRQDGFRLWGNRTTSSDPKYAFLCVRRTADIIIDSIQRAHLWAIDRPITKTYVKDVTERVTAYLRDLKNQGAIIDGKCWADPDLNTPANISNGEVFFDFDFAPTYPAEHITFRVSINNDYLSEIVSTES